MEVPRQITEEVFLKFLAGFQPDGMGDHKIDLLGIEGVRDRVVEWIRSPSNERARIGAIEGAWGSGKSALWQSVQERLEKESCPNEVIVRFSPWLAQNRETLVTEIFITIADKVNVKPGFEKIAGAIHIFSQLATFLQIPDEFKPGVAALGVAANNISDWIKRKTEHKKNLANEIKTSGLQITLVVEDIDRMGDDDIHYLFQLLRGVLDFPFLTAILVYDPIQVEHALAQRSANGTRFSEKFIEARFIVPPLKIATRKKLITVGFSALNIIPEEEHFLHLELINQLLVPRLDTVRKVGVFFSQLKQSAQSMFYEGRLVCDARSLVAVQYMRQFEPTLLSELIQNLNLINAGFQSRPRVQAAVHQPDEITPSLVSDDRIKRDPTLAILLQALDLEPVTNIHARTEVNTFCNEHWRNIYLGHDTFSLAGGLSDWEDLKASLRNEEVPESFWSQLSEPDKAIEWIAVLSEQTIYSHEEALQLTILMLEREQNLVNNPSQGLCSIAVQLLVARYRKSGGRYEFNSYCRTMLSRRGFLWVWWYVARLTLWHHPDPFKGSVPNLTADANQLKKLLRRPEIFFGPHYFFIREACHEAMGQDYATVFDNMCNKKPFFLNFVRAEIRLNQGVYGGIFEKYESQFRTLSVNRLDEHERKLLYQSWLSHSERKKLSPRPPWNTKKQLAPRIAKRPSA